MDMMQNDSNMTMNMTTSDAASMMGMTDDSSGAMTMHMNNSDASMDDMMQDMDMDMDINMDMDMDMGSMMSPFFYAAPGGQFYYLFERLYVESTGGLIGACIFSVFFAAFCQIVNKHLSVFAKYKQDSSLGRELLGGLAIAIQTALHYFVMLVVMSFNVYIFICVMIGSGMGNIMNNYLRRRNEKHSSNNNNNNNNNNKTSAYAITDEFTPNDKDDESESETNQVICH
mmetsp:Transcript_18906/g.21930  ORF Transcript_18906/g.21930 Transcript_18906/m.21930 type:complete len:228 (-) Transcript_18906:60-743(-)